MEEFLEERPEEMLTFLQFFLQDFLQKFSSKTVEEFPPLESGGNFISLEEILEEMFNLWWSLL